MRWSNAPILGIRGQLFIAFGGVFAILVAIYLVAISTSEHYVNVSRQAARDHLDSITASRDMREAVDDVVTAAGQPRPTDAIAFNAARLDEALKAFDQAMSLQLSRATLPGEEAPDAGDPKRLGEDTRHRGRSEPLRIRTARRSFATGCCLRLATSVR